MTRVELAPDVARDTSVVADADPRGATTLVPEHDPGTHPLTVVLGGAGGVGATFVACGVALASAAAGEPVALAELDLERGDLAGAWGIPAERTLDDLTRVIDELVPTHIELVCHSHESGVSVLLSPRRPGASRVWDAPATRILLRSARMLGPVVVDAGASLGAHIQEACRQADRVVVVAAPTLTGARRTRAVLDILGSWQVVGARCLVVNRGVGRDQLAARVFARAVGLPVTTELPSCDADADAVGAGRWPGRRRGRGLAEGFASLARGEGT